MGSPNRDGQSTRVLENCTTHFWGELEPSLETSGCCSVTAAPRWLQRQQTDRITITITIAAAAASVIAIYRLLVDAAVYYLK